MDVPDVTVGRRDSVTLADALDRILHRGVSLEGKVAIGLADVDLLYLDLRLLLGSVDTIWPEGPPSLSPLRPRVPTSSTPAPAQEATPAPFEPQSREEVTPVTAGPSIGMVAGEAPPANGASAARGLVRLVLTIAKLLHDTLERQAVRRMTDGRLSDAQIDRLGSALLAQAEQLLEMQHKFGLSDQELSLNLGVSDRNL